MHFEYSQKILFKYCDPAGIVFFPRYAELVNDVVEAFFCTALNWSFEDMHPDASVPTAEINLKFLAPSRHGDLLILKLAVQHIGTASLRLVIEAFCGDECRFISEQTLVCVNENGKPSSWPISIKDKIVRMVETVK